MLKACVHGADNRQKRGCVHCAVRQRGDMRKHTGREMSYIETLLSILILASVIVVGVMLGIGWVICKLIDSHWEIGGRDANQ